MPDAILTVREAAKLLKVCDKTGLHLDAPDRLPRRENRQYNAHSLWVTDGLGKHSGNTKGEPIMNKNEFAHHLRRFLVALKDKEDGERLTVFITLDKTQLQAAQIVGESSKKLIQRIADRNGYELLKVVCRICLKPFSILSQTLSRILGRYADIADVISI